MPVRFGPHSNCGRSRAPLRNVKRKSEKGISAVSRRAGRICRGGHCPPVCLLFRYRASRFPSARVGVPSNSAVAAVGPPDFHPVQVGVSFNSAVAAGSSANQPLVARAATGCSFAPRQRNQSAQGFALDPRGWRPRPTAIWRAAQGVGFFHRRAPRSTRQSFRQSVTPPFALLWLPKKPPSKESLPAAEKQLRRFSHLSQPTTCVFFWAATRWPYKEFYLDSPAGGFGTGPRLSAPHRWGSRLTPGLARACGGGGAVVS